ncbi:MAG: hypothetical protein EI684_14925 [Candidatus Viridilinea halotolerans]|uniref:Uncharacterized protein n=1 Tax=Candidatus Viridilinea halotolerans TaxID=2491704 RepID=A0A426TW58_9CHLR|nr:MAG: hypothetical protein EI684_14925 [Candidatus Viridilinea halotolerans]
MTIEPVELRAVAVRVFDLLRDDAAPLEQRVMQARALLDRVLTRSTSLDAAQRANLDNDPSVQAALARLGDNESYVLADADGEPSDISIHLDSSVVERPVDAKRLAELGLSF